MRPAIAALLFCALLPGTPAALAAPTCRDQHGGTMKCGTEGAMPVGWNPPPEVWQQRIPGPESPGPRELLEVFTVIGLLFALIALLPEFDGSQDGDWGGRDED